jgi:hypothetical protein
MSDIVRRLMAAIYEIGNQVKDITGGVGVLGTMARQNKELVDIDGGTISAATLDSTNAINAGAIKSGSVPVDRLAGTAANLVAGDTTKAFGLTKQQLYDMVWPVGSERAWDKTDLTGLVPEGVTATWSRRALDSLLVGAGSTYSYGVAQGSGTDATAAGTAITIAQMPAHTHGYEYPDDGGTGQVNNAAPSGSTGPYSTFTTSSTGGGGTHTHVISLPTRYPTVWVKRTA